jgi:hypothetical protein
MTLRASCRRIEPRHPPARASEGQVTWGQSPQQSTAPRPQTGLSPRSRRHRGDCPVSRAPAPRRAPRPAG